jgi:hypothetical protein
MKRVRSEFRRVRQPVGQRMTPAEFKIARERYTYVPARLIRVADDEKADRVCFGLRLRGHVPQEWPARASSARVDISSIELDEFHGGLLRSTADDDLLHGLLSVVFWGFASGTDGRLHLDRAIARASAIAHGRANAAPQTPETVLKLLRQVRQLVDTGTTASIAAAFLTALQIKFLQMAFASKLLMFMQPATLAVYDEVVSLRLLGHPDPQLRELYVSTALPTSPAAHERQAQTYARWCQWCSHGRLLE